MSHRVRRLLLTFAAAVLLFLGLVRPAAAHGFTSTVYAHVTADRDGPVRTELKLEYDLLVVSAADAGDDDPSSGTEPTRSRTGTPTRGPRPSTPTARPPSTTSPGASRSPRAAPPAHRPP